MTDLCYHLVATIYVIRQTTLEFYKNVLCDALQNQPTCVALFILAFRRFTFVFVCYRNNLSVFLNVFNISLTCVLCRF
jgi:hypothetical protein